jgi:pimeloyl-ACP methyl ester carboxylesterase
VSLFWVGFAITWSVPVTLVIVVAGMTVYLRWKYIHLIERIFQERPLFIVPRGQPATEAEDVSFPTVGGLRLRGCYFRTPKRRRGVILFGLEFGSDRWSCRAYCDHLIEAGFDVFAFEPRSQGESDAQPGYDPLQWVTEFEVQDTSAALDYLKNRPDADLRGIGFFGISKGGVAGLIAASRDRFVRCCVTDGIFGTYSTLVPYMRHYIRIYNNSYWFQALIPSWYYGRMGLIALRRVARRRRCRFPHLEKRMPRLAPRPLFMIHGEADTYIKPDMAEGLFARAKAPKEFWLVERAKHNQALHLVGEEYRRRVLEFFERHLSGDHEATAVSSPVAPSALSASASTGGMPTNGEQEQQPETMIPTAEMPHASTQSQS